MIELLALGAAAFLGWGAGVLVGIQRGRRMRDKWLRRRPKEDIAIEEAKTLYACGAIDKHDFETRIGHLIRWDGEP